MRGLGEEIAPRCTGGGSLLLRSLHDPEDMKNLSAPNGACSSARQEPRWCPSVLREAHERQVEETMDALEDGPKRFYKSYLGD